MSDDTDADEETYSAIRTVLGSTHRTARWHLTDEVDVLTALGRSSFDLRLVETTGRPVAEISVTCFLGTVNLVVPPGTLVVLDGTSFLARAASEVEPGAASALPRIEVTATTVLGRVRVVSRELEEATAIDVPPAIDTEALVDLPPIESDATETDDADVAPGSEIADDGEPGPDAEPLAS